ncbi:MAG: GNAT family N-acetyltransferase [Bacteroidota bacterium]
MVIGKALLETLHQEAKEKDYPIVIWQVLDWNKNAIDFYESLGAELAPEWINCFWEVKK